jgi:Ca-activated chloride channel family protein
MAESNLLADRGNRSGALDGRCAFTNRVALGSSGAGTGGDGVWSAAPDARLNATRVLDHGPAPYVQQQPIPVFKSGIDLVQVSAVVRDRKGRFVKNLTIEDFVVIDGGQPRRISDFRHDMSGVTVALLFDVSGSMSSNLTMAREAGSHVLSWLLDARDEAAIYTFDSRLDEITPFTSGMKRLPERLQSMKPFGATSLHDAIAQTAQQLAPREGRRRAVVVFTDGNDTASRLTPGEVSGIASSIDVPVYIFGVVPAIDNPTAERSATTHERSPLSGALTNLAYWTGGLLFAVSTPADRSSAARQVIDELRHQYLIAFESSGTPGWHPLEVRARSKDLTVRARSGYIAGQSRPVSH